MSIMDSTETTLNPLTLGGKLAILGGAGGLGWAAMLKAIRARKARRTGEPERHTSIALPVLAGALAGGTLGTGLGMKAWKERQHMNTDPNAPIRSKGETKYAVLLHAMEKKAIFDSYANLRDAHPLASTGTSFIPGVGAVTSGMDALNSFGRGEWLSGIGSTLMVPLGLVGASGLAGVLKQLPRMARITRAARAGGQGVRAARAGMVAENVASRAGTQLAREAGASPILSNAPKGMRSGGRFSAGMQMLGAKMMPQSFANTAAQGAGAQQWIQRGRNLDSMFGVGKKIETFQNIPGLRHATRFGLMQTAALAPMGIELGQAMHDATPDQSMQMRSYANPNPYYLNRGA